jgi:dihydroorotate dehydrogenase (fumarate)
MQEAGADALELNAWFMPGDPKVSPAEALEDTTWRCCAN